MNQTLLKIYGNDLLLESEYLNFYGYPDYDFVHEIDDL